jgi:nucleoside-diphosphate-sugar epimerase
MRVLVTGASGFIGAHVAARLAADGHDVIAVDRSEPERKLDQIAYFSVDLLDSDRLMTVFADARPQALVHLAARTDLDGTSVDDYAANTQGVRNVLAAVRATPSLRRAVYTSTQLVCRVGYAPRSDTDYQPDTAYGRSKVVTEQTVRAEDGGGVDWCLARPTTVWGPGMGRHYQRFFRLIASGRYIHVGRRPLKKSYGYVGNIAHQYASMLSVEPGAIRRRTFYLADYEPLSLRAWADAFQRALGAPPIRTLPEPLVRLAARAGDVLNVVGWRSFPYNSFRLRNVLTEYVFDLSATRDVCGPLPYDASAGVAATVAWLRGSGIVGTPST